LLKKKIGKARSMPGIILRRDAEVLFLILDKKLLT